MSKLIIKRDSHRLEKHCVLHWLMDHAPRAEPHRKTCPVRVPLAPVPGLNENVTSRKQLIFFGSGVTVFHAWPSLRQSNPV